MPAPYFVLKFVHIAAVMIWIGAMLMLAVLQGRLAGARDREALVALARYAGFIGMAIVAPAAVVALAAGVALVIVQEAYTFSAFWISWGFIGVFVGGYYGHRIGKRMKTLAEYDSLDAPKVGTIRRRWMLVDAAVMMLLFSVVWVMIAKPTF